MMIVRNAVLLNDTIYITEIRVNRTIMQYYITTRQYTIIIIIIIM